MIVNIIVLLLTSQKSLLVELLQKSYVWNLITNEGNKYYCSKCNTEVKFVIRKYNLQIHVMDGIGFILLLLRNKEVLQPIGKTANKLKEGLIRDANSAYPSELDDLIEKTNSCLNLLMMKHY
ncbi:hypothetical protein H5410_021756 [Solanum commersonii]|uniref:Uncharacterized protein n=1 Tax=Solanum commersonii TaxID=4109 RepID=A0A9J5ZBX6_SOLCO|nr:hypothetical protein H5410_021756 [Solanum commersonii]